jgi:hypothetical protein
MTARGVRQATRYGSVAVSLLAGVLAVTWGGASAMKPFTTAQLADANCGSHTVYARASGTSISVGGLDPACADGTMRVTVFNSDRAVLADVPAQLTAGAAGRLQMALPPGVSAADVAGVNVAPLNG